MEINSENTGTVDSEPIPGVDFGAFDQAPGFEQDTREETYRLALESIVRWTDRSFDTDFRDALIVRAIAQVAEVALDGK